MKRLLFLLFFGLCMVHLVKAQVKIGENPQVLDGASVLELESTDKVLVITRVNTTQMNAITPLQGALVYNIDVQSVHYYDGTQWVNIGGGGGAGGPLTADPIVNDISTIVITPTGTGDNLEVAENSIGTTQIRDFSINGTEDILDGSIGTGKFGEDVITQFELSENSVGAIELDNANIGLSAFANDVGYITSASIVSIDTDNALQIGTDNGAFYDETPLLNAIQDNADDIATDNDQSPSNEIQNLTLTGSVIGLTDTGGTIDIGPLVSGGGSDDQNIGPVTFDAGSNELSIGIEGGNAGTVNLSALAGGGGSTEVADQTTITGVGTAGDPFKIEPGGNGQFLTTNAGGAVAWATVTPGGGGTTEVVDGTLLTGAGTAGDPFTIAPGGADQILRTNAAGDALAWVPLPTGGAVISDDTLEGDGSSAATALGLADDAVTIEKIAPGDADQILRTNAAGDAVAWVPLPTGSAVISDATLEGDGSSAATALSLADNAVTLEKIAPNGATTDGQIIQWNTDLDGPGPGTDAGWEIAENAGHLGNNQNNVFFAGPGGLPYDTESNDDGSFASERDNGGFFWDSSKRFDSGALYLGLKLYGNADGTSTIESDPEGHSKLILAEKYNAASGEFSLAFPLQLRNESNTAGTGAGILFAVNTAGNPGKGALVFQRGTAESEGDFHFLVSQTNPDVRPAFNESVFTVENDGDIVLTGDLFDKNDDPMSPTPVGYVLTNTISGTEWAPAGGLPNMASDTQVLTWDEDAVSATEGAWVAANATANEQDIALDVANDEIDLLESNGTTVSSSISLDGVTLEAFDSGTPANAADDFIRVKPAEPLSMVPTDQKKQILVTSPDGTAIGWEELPTGGSNLATANLTQSAEDRTYDLNGNQLVFEGSGNIGIGDFGMATNPDAPYQKFHVLGEVRSQGFNSSFGTVGAPAYSFAAETTATGDSDTGMWRDDADELVFSAGGQEILRLEENPGTPGTIDAIVSGRLNIKSALRDKDDNTGETGQVLSSTATGVDWIDLPEGPVYKAKINSSETAPTTGLHEVTFTDDLSTDQYVINLSVEEANPGIPIFISVVSQTIAGFTVRITELNGGAANTVSNATWHYTVHNP